MDSSLNKHALTFGDLENKSKVIRLYSSSSHRFTQGEAAEPNLNYTVHVLYHGD